MLNPQGYFLLFIMIILTSCKSRGQERELSQGSQPGLSLPIADYIVDIFEDSNGNLWFGTMAKGVARYDGKSLTYITTDDGLSGNAVVSISEDKDGNLWFGTHSGLTKYAATASGDAGQNMKFENFTESDGLCHDRVSNVVIDKAGNIWVGTWGGVCRFDQEIPPVGKRGFSEFPLPTPDVSIYEYNETRDWVTEILEDSEGNIWIGRSGYGACKYTTDTGEFTVFTKKDGLPSNCVQAIVEDRHGDIWFGCRVAERDNPDASNRTGDGGLSRYDGSTFHHYPGIEGLSRNDIYAIYEDTAGHIWIGATGVGLYRYDGESFNIYNKTNRMDRTQRFGIQSMLNDTNGTMWFGFSGGLFRLDGSSIIHVGQSGPWK